MSAPITYVMKGQLAAPPYQDLSWFSPGAPDYTGALSPYPGLLNLTTVVVDYTIVDNVIAGGNSQAAQIPVPAPPDPIVPEITFVMKGLCSTTQPPNSLIVWHVTGSPDFTGASSGYPIASLSNIVVDYTINDSVTSGSSANPVFTTVELSGDVTGPNYDNEIALLQGVPLTATNPTTGQVLTFNGIAWVPSSASANFVAAGDLSGTATRQTVIGFQTVPVANTPPVQSAVPIYDTSASQYDIRPLTQDDILAGFTINSFTGGSTVEVGATVVNPTFTASYSHEPNSASITNTDGTDSPLTLSAPYTSGTVVGSFSHNTVATVAFTLTAIYTSTKTAVSDIIFLARSFGGIGTASATSANASGNTAVLVGATGTLASEGLHATDVGQAYGPFSPVLQKIYLLLPHTASVHVFHDQNGFLFVMNAPTTFSFTNQNGAVISMDLYESFNILNATYTITVSS